MCASLEIKVRGDNDFESPWVLAWSLYHYTTRLHRTEARDQPHITYEAAFKGDGRLQCKVPSGMGQCGDDC